MKARRIALTAILSAITTLPALADGEVHKLMTEADKKRLEAAYRATIANDIYPAMKRVRDHLQSSYLPKARDGYGLMYMRGGDRVYRHLVQSTTTLPLTPDEIHQTGLSEVARIRGEMEKVKLKMGFTGPLKAFFEEIRTNPKYHPTTKEQLSEGFAEVGRKVDAQIPRFFSTVPKRAPRAPEVRSAGLAVSRTEMFPPPDAPGPLRR